MLITTAKNPQFVSNPCTPTVHASYTLYSAPVESARISDAKTQANALFLPFSLHTCVVHFRKLPMVDVSFARLCSKPSFESLNF